jgi:hypothetical protein
MKIIVVHRSGSLRVNTVDDLTELYRVGKYKTDKDFMLLHKWGVYELWGKQTGKPGNENKYEWPSPHENSLFFGTLCIVKPGADLDLEEWTQWYNIKMGGSEKLEYELESEEDSVYSDDEFTTEGYLKDDFVVEDTEELQYELYH